MANAKPERPSQTHRATARFRREQRALGATVRSLRHDAGWTLEEAAERCDLDWKHLQKLEAGSLNLTSVTLVRVAVGFRRPLGTLFGSPSKSKRIRRDG